MRRVVARIQAALCVVPRTLLLDSHRRRSSVRSPSEGGRSSRRLFVAYRRCNLGRYWPKFCNEGQAKTVATRTPRGQQVSMRASSEARAHWHVPPASARAGCG